MSIYDEAIECLNTPIVHNTIYGVYEGYMLSEEECEFVKKALERAKKVEEFISLCYVETTDTGHEVVFWRDENYEYAKQLLKMLKGEMK